MSQHRDGLLAIYIDGETKTGKGAAGKAIADALSVKDLSVYYDVAGDFYRRYVALVRQYLKLDETEALPKGSRLEAAAIAVHETKRAFAPDETLGDLQRPAIANSVSTLGELPLAQMAGQEWWAMTAKLAQEAGAQVVVLDGRNPRSRMHDQEAKTGIAVHTALDLFMVCEPAVAALRTLLASGVPEPSEQQLKTETEAVVNRRQKDRLRTEFPYIMPAFTVPFLAEKDDASGTINKSWLPRSGAGLPVTVELDNSHISKPDMLAAVSDLASAAVDYLEAIAAK